ncbi:enoyl-CoA hydratase-related protein [Cumulibacter soli]|uniref:enoyl-CoA hydratase-related protein n=1 Tax=Cumulibacter soli TaxID=2546344 RepID=UPI0010684F29|nr:enoyl-CoA hydratase-related protein [Cumulibacter soli]
MSAANATTIDLDSNGTVLAQLRGHTMLITLNRPEARNAVNVQVAYGLGEALEYAERTTDVWCVVLTGTGDKAFCAGADLKASAAGDFDKADERLSRWGFGGYVQHPISKPTIAAVNGFALGGGTELVLASDLAVAAESASFGLPEVKRGIFAAGGGAFRLPRQIPAKVGMEVMLTGRPLTAERALALGLVNAVVPAEQLLDAAFELADAINENAPLAVQATKRTALGITDGNIATENDDWARNGYERERLMQTADSMEGRLAFAEKRAPQWTGR